MQIVNLKLINFRNYNHLEVNFSPTKNIIYGKNGMGKTNLIESIYVLALTKSFRGSLDKILIKKDKNLTKISGVINDITKTDYQITITLDGKATKINGNKINKISDYVSKIYVVLFNPDDLRIIKDSPSIRRKNLNVDISQLDNNYIKILTMYNKLLKQRNAYLKTMYANSNASLEYLDILTSKLVDYGLEIYIKRKEFLEKINQEIKEIYNKICGNSIIDIKYVSNYSNLSKKEILETYKKNLQKDMLFGKTNFGIHHDDFLFSLDHQPFKDYGSEGQQKNAVIAYKLSEIIIFKKEKKTNPILILDDLFSELDYEKINNILSIIDDDIQTFITTTEITHVDDNIRKKAKIFLATDNSLMEE